MGKWLWGCCPVCGKYRAIVRALCIDCFNFFTRDDMQHWDKEMENYYGGLGDRRSDAE